MRLITRRQGLLCLLALSMSACASTMRSASPTPAATIQAFENIADPGFLTQFASTYRFRLGRPSAITPTPDDKEVLFLRSGPRSFVRDLYSLDIATGQERVLLTAQQILQGAEEKLTAEERARRERMRQAARGIASYRLSKDGSRILVPLSGRLFVIERQTDAVTELTSDAGFPIDAQFSPDATKVACVRNGDLYVIDIATGDEQRLTTKQSDTITNGLAEFVAQEEMSRFHGFWWAPDSQSIVYQQTDTAGLETMHIMDATHPEKAPNVWAYPRPGKKNAAVRLGEISAAGGPTIWIDWDHGRYQYLATVRWQENAPLTLVVQNRRQTDEAILAYDNTTGYLTYLFKEHDDAWLNLDQSVPRWLPDGGAFLWTTERNGAWQLELRSRQGELIRAVTPVDLGLRRFVHYQPETGDVIVLASDDPTQVQVYRVPLDPDRGGPRRRTKETGIHSVTFGERGYTHIAYTQTLTGQERWEVIGKDGPTGVQLRSVAEKPPFDVNMELTTVGKDPTFHAVLIKPRHFDRSIKHPVIVHVYGGPGSQMVTAAPSRYILDQWIADHGYVVVSIDARGTPSRGRDWERVTKNDLITIPLQDQIAALKSLGLKYPELDMTRVGIYGWSFGGYFSAMATLREPDVFRAGVAGAPVVDWADYDTHYTERFMDLPQTNPAGYKTANVLTYADQLARPLLIIHGTADDNVYFMHSLKLNDALFKAGKHAEFLPLAGFTHMVPDPLVTTRLYTRIMDFFETNLRKESK